MIRLLAKAVTLWATVWLAHFFAVMVLGADLQAWFT